MTPTPPHKLQWNPGQEGKGFLLKPGANFPQLAGQPPIVWTWPTEGFKPFHDRVKVRTTYEAPQGMLPEPSSFFHITPQGQVWTYGPNRQLTPEDHAAISKADPRLRSAEHTPKVQTDGYGHANRLLEILSGTRIGRWMEWPQRWRER